MTTAKETFSGRAAPEIVAALRNIALAQGQDFETLLEHIISRYIADLKQTEVQGEALVHFQDSLDRDRNLYELVAQ